ncbi:flagellar basal body rod protein FlgB [Angustibacter sp. McL0619]|uniref:flagellar basal body rod protein FlgB n=1 Tax=Angustibacter sp. McL0619 TaxID=3415676 RepID=UPI003CEAD238
MFDDVTSVALRSALTGLAARQRSIADNIANVETPGYHSTKVSFEDSLRSAVDDGSIASGSVSSVAPTTQTSLEPTRLNGNNVNLDTETLSSVDTNLRYQLTLRAVDHDFSILKTSMRSA